MIYIYESHMGYLYAGDERLNLEELYCEQCEDSDTFIGTVDSIKELYELFAGKIDDGKGSGGWDKEYFEEFAKSVKDILEER